jgi:hypothetical protein
MTKGSLDHIQRGMVVLASCGASAVGTAAAACIASSSLKIEA